VSREKILRWLSALIIGVAVPLAACGRMPLPSNLPLPVPTPTPRAVPADALVVTNGTVIDGTGADPLLNGLVVIQDEHISAIGRASDFTLAPTVRIVDAQGGTILPGMINAHTHEAASPLVRQAFFLRYGVTSACELGNPLITMSRYADPTGYGLTARGFNSGPFINVAHGYPGDSEFLYVVTNEAETRRAVDDLVARGADMLKIALEPGNSKLPWQVAAPDPIANLGRAELVALVDQAHRHNKLVRVHLGTQDMLDLALDVGVDTIEHIPLPRLDQIQFRDALQGVEYAALAPEYEAQLARMVKQGVILVPTIDKIITWCESYALTQERKTLCQQYALTPVHRFHQLGGIIALGDDASSEPRTRMPLAEMRRMLSAGLTPMQVLVASTKTAAHVCGHGHELGTLEPGKLADVIITDGNPLLELDALARVRTVILGGKIAR